MALLKVELANGMLLSNRVAHALAAVTQQLAYLNAREDLRIPLNQLMVTSTSSVSQCLLLMQPVCHDDLLSVGDGSRHVLSCN